MPRADHIYVPRLGYDHHAIDLGDGSVIHYTGEVGQKSNAAVRQTSLAEFANGGPVRVRLYSSCHEPDVVIARAMSRLGESSYHLVFNNCEHFATWCKCDSHESEQVKDFSAVAGGAVGSGSAVAAGLGTVSATGAAAGLSGSGIMSGLATVGGAVGGGAVAGIVVVGTAPAALTAGAMMLVLKDDPVLHEAEREARQVGRMATVAGAVAGSAASVGAVAATGTVGLSAAGISSGLAAVGGAVGGGMAAGVVVTAAAPALAAAAVGDGAYRVWKLWTQG
jgi:hypothetical protein